MPELWSASKAEIDTHTETRVPVWEGLRSGSHFGSWSSVIPFLLDQGLSLQQSSRDWLGLGRKSSSNPDVSFCSHTLTSASALSPAELAAIAHAVLSVNAEALRAPPCVCVGQRERERERGVCLLTVLCCIRGREKKFSMHNERLIGLRSVCEKPPVMTSPV